MAASQNRSFVNYIPNDNPEYVVPVQQGSVYNLCVALTPAGQGICGWYDPTANSGRGEYRVAVVPDFDDVFTDDVVPPGDVRTAYSSATRTVYTGSLWAWNGLLYIFVSTWLTTNGRIECYVADDIENPVSWTLVGTVQSHTGPAPFNNPTVREAGIPTVTDSGRWILPFHSYLTFALAELTDGLGLFTSDDSGANWTTRISFRRTALLGGSAGPQATTVGYEPGTDDYWFGARIGGVNQWRPYQSTDDGSTWAVNDRTEGNVYPAYFMDNGTTMYASILTAASADIYAIEPGDDPKNPDSWTDLNMRGVVNGAYNVEDGFQVIPIISNGALLGVAFTVKDRVAYHPLCEPVHPEPLFIPHKDRLLTLANDFTEASIVKAQDDQFDNFKVIERWAEGWMTLTESPDRCDLFIPYKDHARHPPEVSAAQSFDNWKEIERWAHGISDGDCGCNCSSAAEPPDRCRLFIPYKDHLLGVDPLDEEAMSRASSREFDNFNALERWAFLYSSGTCGCTV